MSFLEIAAHIKCKEVGIDPGDNTLSELMPNWLVYAAKWLKDQDG